MKEYVPLRKFCYKNDRENEAEYKNRIHSENTVVLKSTVKGKPCFFVNFMELYKRLLEIERKCNKIDRIIGVLPNVALKQYTRQCLIEEIVLTNDMEGIHSTRKEIGTVLGKVVGSAPNRRKLRFESVVNKYRLLETEDMVPLSTAEDIRTLYDEMMLEEVLLEDPENVPDGKVFRKATVYVQNGVIGKAHEGVMPESEIIREMNYALEMLQDDSIELIFRISMFHYLFGYIHPFYEGNGRTSRFISSYLLSRYVNPLLGYRLSSSISENHTRYLKAFRECNDPLNHADLTPFIITFTEIIQHACDVLYHDLDDRYLRFKELVKKLKTYTRDEEHDIQRIYYYLLQAELFSEVGISIPELLSLLNCSRGTLTRKIRHIESKGDLVVTKLGASKHYKLALDHLL